MDEPNTGQPLVFQALEEPLLQVLDETQNPPVQNETLHWMSFVRVVVYYFVAGIASGRLLLTHLAHADPARKLTKNLNLNVRKNFGSKNRVFRGFYNCK
ncbi:MAG: hypothetical protein ACFCD0_18645 [Gemmataceae bacterium]